MKRLVILIILLSGLYYLNAQQYEIKVKIKGLENQQIILGHHKAENLIPDDTLVLDKNGYGVFKEKNLRKGLYFIFLPSKTYFDFLIGNDKKFFIENDTADLIKNLKITGSQENKIFLEYQEFFFEKNKQLKELNDKMKSADKKEKKKIREKIDKNIKEIKDYISNIEKQYPDLYVSKFIKATQKIEVPEEITDKKQQYYYYKNHYFDYFDYADPSMLYTPFYFSKIDYYLDKIVMQNPDTLISEIDKMLQRTKATKDSLLYKTLLTHLYNKYARSQMMIAENVYVFIAEAFIKDGADWIPKSRLEKIKKNILRKKNCLIGMQAPDLQLNILPADSSEIEKLRPYLAEMKKKGLEIEKDKSRTFEEKLPDLSALILEFMNHFPQKIDLYNIKSKYTILWFMSPDCSHCRHETPLFYKTYLNELKKYDVTVITIYLEKNTDNWRLFSDDIGKWLDFVEKHKFYQWYNAWNPFANYRFKYDINSTPVLYLLDKDKKIIAKRIGYEQAKQIILDLEKEK